MKLEIRLNGIEVTLQSAQIHTSESVLEACQSLLQAIQKVSESENRFPGIEFEPTIERKPRTCQFPPPRFVRRQNEEIGKQNNEDQGLGREKGGRWIPPHWFSENQDHRNQ